MGQCYSPARISASSKVIMKTDSESGMYYSNSYEMDSSKRHKKSDKAKEKAGRPSSRHVREYQKRIAEAQDRTKEPRHKK